MINWKDYEFRWNDWNTDHIGEHGVSPREAEYVVNHARPPFPRKIGDGRYLVQDQTADSSYLQVIYIFSPPGVIFVIHARRLTAREVSRLKRNRK